MPKQVVGIHIAKNQRKMAQIRNYSESLLFHAVVTYKRSNRCGCRLIILHVESRQSKQVQDCRLTYVNQPIRFACELYPEVEGLDS